MLSRLLTVTKYSALFIAITIVLTGCPEKPGKNVTPTTNNGIAPKVVKTIPGAEQGNVATNTLLEISFDKPIKRASWTVDKVIIFPISRDPVSGLIVEDRANKISLGNDQLVFVLGDDRKLRINLKNTALSLNMHYQIEITGVTDYPGTPMPGTCQWRFTTTGANPDVINIGDSGLCGAAIPQWVGTKQLGGTFPNLATTPTTYGRGIAVDSKGNVYVVGDTGGNVDGKSPISQKFKRDYFVAKYDSVGTKKWVRQLGVANKFDVYVIGYDISIDSMDNVYITGETTGDLEKQTRLNGGRDFFITKYDSNGKKKWIRQLGGGGTRGNGISIDSTDNVYVAGSTNHNLDGKPLLNGYSFFVTKYDSTGVKKWLNQLGVAGGVSGRGISIDSNDNVYIVGDTNGNLGKQTLVGARDLFVTKYNSIGKIQWTKLLGVTGGVYTYGIGISIDSTDNVYVTGDTGGKLGKQPLVGVRDFFVIKYSSVGTIQWTRQLGVAGGNTYGKGISIDSMDNVYVTGYTYGGLDGQTPVGGSDFFVTKYNSAGTKQWTRQLGVAGGNTFGQGISIDSKNHVYITGSTTGGLDGNTKIGTEDFFITKYNSLGVRQ